MKRESPTHQRLTTITEREDDTYVALCPELDITSQGETAAQAHSELREAVDLFLEFASPDEVHNRLQSRAFHDSQR